MSNLFNSILGFNVKEYISNKNENKSLNADGMKYNDVDFCINFASNKTSAQKNEKEGFNA